jgi:hypothetical protein
MDKILAKQFDGGQNYEGLKLRFNEGFIYWIAHENIYNEEGNCRLGSIEGTIVMQNYSEGRWNTIY